MINKFIWLYTYLYDRNKGKPAKNENKFLWGENDGMKSLLLTRIFIGQN